MQIKPFITILLAASMLAPTLSAQDLILEDLGPVARVTGKTTPGEILPNPNRTDERWNLGGTDLGIIWEVEPGKYALTFGDTYGADFKPVQGGGPGSAGDWRSNVVGFSENTDLERGIIFSDMMHDASDPDRASAVIVREDYREFTYIPTAAIALNGVQYMHYMYWEVFYRDMADKFYGSFCRSFDGGNTWENCNDMIRFGADSYFSMVALAQRPGDEYCYMLGTRTGRGYRKSCAKLARFTADNVLDKDEYEFWDGEARMWVKGDENRATTLLDGTVGEASLAYMEEYGKWLAIYIDSEKHGICYRSADEITGPWSEERILVTGKDYPGCYGSFIHPISAHKGDGTLYYTMSRWYKYNVFLMQAAIYLDN